MKIVPTLLWAATGFLASSFFLGMAFFVAWESVEAFEMALRRTPVSQESLMGSFFLACASIGCVLFAVAVPYWIITRDD